MSPQFPQNANAHGTGHSDFEWYRRRLPKLICGGGKIAGIAVMVGIRAFCGECGGWYPEVPDAPEKAGRCSPEFPEVDFLACGECGVWLRKQFLTK